MRLIRHAPNPTTPLAHQEVTGISDVLAIGISRLQENYLADDFDELDDILRGVADDPGRLRRYWWRPGGGGDDDDDGTSTAGYGSRSRISRGGCRDFVASTLQLHAVGERLRDDVAAPTVFS